jgi:hypothetical protein
MRRRRAETAALATVAATTAVAPDLTAFDAWMSLGDGSWIPRAALSS